MALIDEWVKDDVEFKEMNEIVKNLGYTDLKEFITKHKDKSQFPKVTEEIIN